MSGAGNVDPSAGWGPAQLLSFLLAGEEYALDILRVREIRGWEGATPLPNAPHYVRGVTSLRGTIVPLIDLRLRFGLEPREPHRSTVVIILQVADEDRARLVGIVVDAVSDVHQLDPSQLVPAPELASADRSPFARALASLGDRLVIVLDVDRVAFGAPAATRARAQATAEEAAPEARPSEEGE